MIQFRTTTAGAFELDGYSPDQVAYIAAHAPEFDTFEDLKADLAAELAGHDYRMLWTRAAERDFLTLQVTAAAYVAMGGDPEDFEGDEWVAVDDDVIEASEDPEPYLAAEAAMSAKHGVANVTVDTEF